MKKIILVNVLLLLIVVAKVQGQNTDLSGLLWKITGNGLNQPSYLYLTSSSCDEKLVLTEKIKGILHSVNFVAVEIDLSDKNNAAKLQGALMAEVDSQKVKNILPASEYQQFVKKAKDEGAPDQAIDQFNMFKPLVVLSLLQMQANICETGTQPEKIETVLKSYSSKNKQDFKELVTIDETIKEMNAHSKEYWRQNIMYALNNTDQIKQALQNKIALYKTGNISEIKVLFNDETFFALRSKDDVYKSHVMLVADKIEGLVKQQSGFIALDISNIGINTLSVLDILKTKGFQVNVFTN